MTSKAKTIVWSIGAGLVLAYLLGSIAYVAGAPNIGTCSGVQVQVDDSADLQFVTSEEIIKLLRANDLYPAGTPIGDVNTDKIEALVRKHSLVRNAECYKMPNNKLRIRIVQRVPKFRVAGAENYYVDSERRSMPTSTNFAAYVPVVTGRVSIDMARNELYDFVDFVENDDFWNAQIEQINVLEGRQVELVPRIGTHTILLGQLDDYEAKLEKMKTLYTEGFGKVGWPAYTRIDLRYKNQIVCRK